MHYLTIEATLYFNFSVRTFISPLIKLYRKRDFLGWYLRLTADLRIQLPGLLVRRSCYKEHITLSVFPFDNFLAQYYLLVLKYLYVCFSVCFMFVYLSIYLVVCISYLSIYYIYLYWYQRKAYHNLLCLSICLYIPICHSVYPIYLSIVYVYLSIYTYIRGRHIITLSNLLV